MVAPGRDAAVQGNQHAIPALSGKSREGLYKGRSCPYNSASLLVAESGPRARGSLKIEQPIGVGACGAEVVVGAGPEIEGLRI